MEKYMDIFSKLAFVLLVLWVVMAGLGKADMPGSRRRKGGRGMTAMKAQPLVTTYAESTGAGFRLSNM